MAEAVAAGDAPALDATPGAYAAAGPPAAWIDGGSRGPLTGQVYAGWSLGGIDGDDDGFSAGLGTTYRCRSLEGDRCGLLQVLEGRDAADPERVRVLLAKAREALPLASPATLRVLHAGTWAGVPFTLREHQPGTDLATVLRRAGSEGVRLEVGEALELAVQLAHGLADAAACGLAHGDLHPRWLRLTPAGVLRIAGFGRATPPGDDGTYRAPEVIDALADHRGDLYAVGCILYHLWCGRPPFSAPSPTVLRRHHRFHEPTRPSKLDRRLGPEHDAVLRACLQKQPQERYATAADLARDLAALQAGTLTEAARRGLTSTGAIAATRAYVSALTARLTPPLATLAVVGATAAAAWGWWREHSAQVTAQRLQRAEAPLVALDRSQPVPDQAQAHLDAYAATPGADQGLAAQRGATLARIGELRRALAVLDGTGELGGAALATVGDQLAEYTTLVGPAARRAQAWARALAARQALQAGRLASIEGLATADAAKAAAEPAALGALAALRLGDGADPTVVAAGNHIDALAAAARNALAGLEALVVLDPAGLASALGDLRLLQALDPADPSLRASAARLAVLAGPGRPAWAGEAGRDAFGAFAVVAVPGAPALRLRWVPPGAATLGSPHDEPGRRADEAAGSVALAEGWWMAETECTQALWRVVTGAAPSHLPGDTLPVDSVSWHDAQAFMTRLAARIGHGFAPRLPREVEWERACRAGLDGPYSAAVPSDRATARVAWFKANAGGTSHPVATLAANPLGLFDQHGNVAEWCQEVYAPAGAGHAGAAEGPRVARGGSWAEGAAGVRAATRIAADPGTRTRFIGLRIAADPGWPGGAPPDLLATGAGATP
jgi:formylglycine-generating enzyme required for sulfatase activity